MMEISIQELKDNLEKYIGMVGQQNIIVTDNGKRVAKIVSAKTDKVAALQSLLADVSFETGLDVSSLVNAESRLSPTLSVVANLVSVHSGKKKGYADRMKRHLEIIFDALLTNDSYKKEVGSWDKTVFLLAAQLHDVGETAVPENFLKKSGELTEDEFKDIKTHTDSGIKIVQQVKENLEVGVFLNHAEVLAGSHHEKWDGTGYPLGLKGEAIPLQGRIMAIVDVYDALTTDRPHREKKTHKEAVEIIKKGSGTHFDPGLVEAFLATESEFDGVG